MIFDSHAHLISADQTAYPPRPLRGKLSPGEFDDPMTAEKLLRLMDETGVKAACAVQRAHVYGYENDYILDSAQQHPDRFRAVVVLPAQSPDTPASLRRLVTERGAAGVRYVAPSFPVSTTEWLSADEAVASWQAAAELGIPICIHVLHVQRESVLPALATMVGRFPDATVVVDHVGGAHAATVEQNWLTSQGRAPGEAFIDSAIALAEHPNVVMKYSTINLENCADGAAFLDRAVSVFGSDRVIWGSDIGQSRGDYAHMVRDAVDATANLDETARRAVLYGNAARIYKI